MFLIAHLMTGKSTEWCINKQLLHLSGTYYIVAITEVICSANSYAENTELQVQANSTTSVDMQGTPEEVMNGRILAIFQ